MCFHWWHLIFDPFVFTFRVDVNNQFFFIRKEEDFLSDNAVREDVDVHALAIFKTKIVNVGETFVFLAKGAGNFHSHFSLNKGMQGFNSKREAFLNFNFLYSDHYYFVIQYEE